MRAIKKFGAVLMCLALMLGCVPGIPVKAAEKAALSIASAENGILKYKYSETKKLSLNVKNTGNVDLKNIRIEPRVNEDMEAWPFEIENKDYGLTIDSLAAGAEKKVEFSFTARENVASKYYKLPFDFTAQTYDESGSNLDGEYGIYVKTEARPETNPPAGDANQGGSQNSTQNGSQGGSQGSANQGGSDAGQEPAVFSGDGGGVMNSDPVSSGGSSGSTLTPKVIVTGFSTDPAEVKAGSNFKLTIHLQNTSKKTTVYNMLFNLSAPTEGSDAETSSPAFLPASGSSSIYLEKIKAGGAQDISIELNAKSDLVQKPYSIDLTMQYEDGQGGQFESASAISIPVRQDARFEFSEFEISPESITVGEEANIMCSLYNLGRVKLYNVKAKFEGTGIQSEEVFIGNVESGATATIDGMVTGESATDGLQTMKMILSYEDESGKITTAEKEFRLEIAEEVMEMGTEEMTAEETGGFSPVIPIIAAVLIAAAAVVGLVIYRKKKKQKLEEEEEGFIDEMDGLTEDEPRES